MASSSDITLTITPPITIDTTSSSTNNQDKIKHDVFLSFRGKDTRKNFTAHLHKALTRIGIDAYIDIRLDGGERIETLYRKIAECLVSVVIFSPKYADSRWCMDELVKILECKENMGQRVLPVLVGVEPIHVMEQTGEFGDGFKRLLEKSKEREKMEKTWRKAMVEIANSLESDSNGKSEDKIIEEIVATIKEILDSVCANDLEDGSFVGSGRTLNVESLLRLDSKEEVHSVGIFGCSGIGKTTIARNVFCRHSNAFDGACLLENIAKKSQSEGLHSLQKDMIAQLLGPEDYKAGLHKLPTHIKRKLKGKRVLIVLDEVGTVQQLKTLLGPNICDSGSRIIVTSKDFQVLKSGCTDIYEVKRLNNFEATQLFIYHAFKQVPPSGKFIDLSERVVAYAKGLPSVLVNLGSDLYGKSIEEWESQLAKLQETLDKTTSADGV